VRASKEGTGTGSGTFTACVTESLAAVPGARVLGQEGALDPVDSVGTAAAFALQLSGGKSMVVGRGAERLASSVPSWSLVFSREEASGCKSLFC